MQNIFDITQKQRYNKGTKGGGTMTASEKVKALLKAVNVSENEVSKRIGMTRQNLSYKLTQNRLSVKDLEDIAAAVGAEVQITFIVPEKHI